RLHDLPGPPRAPRGHAARHPRGYGPSGRAHRCGDHQCWHRPGRCLRRPRSAAPGHPRPTRSDRGCRRARRHAARAGGARAGDLRTGRGADLVAEQSHRQGTVLTAPDPTCGTLITVETSRTPRAEPLSKSGVGVRNPYQNGGVGRALAIGRHTLFALLLVIGAARALNSGDDLRGVGPLVAVTAAWYVVGTAWRRTFVTAGAGPWWLLGLTLLWGGLVAASSDFVWA